MYGMLLGSVSRVTSGEPLVPIFLTLKDPGGPASLKLCNGHDGPQWLEEADDSQRGLLQAWREDKLIQGDTVVVDFENVLLQEGKGEVVSCGKEHNVDVLLPAPVLKNHSRVGELLHVGLHQHPARNDGIGQVVPHNRVLAEKPVRSGRRRELSVNRLCWVRTVETEEKV